MIVTVWLALHFLVALLAPKIISYYGLFSFPEQLIKYKLPHFLSAFANFDGAQYLKIVNEGYSQYRHAFFPLYPVAIKLFGLVTGGNYLIAGLFVSILSFIVGVYFFSKYLAQIGIRKTDVWWVKIFILTFPTAFFLQGLYTESLFFLFVVLMFYFLKQKKYIPVVIFSFLASLTRFIGVFLFVPIILSWFFHKRNNNLNLKWLLAGLAPFFGLGLYTFYLFKTTGDQLAFFHDQPAFGAGRSTSIIFLPQVYFRYLKIVLTASHNLQYFVSLLELAIFTLVLIVLLIDFKNNWKNNDRFILGVFSAVNLVFPTLTGTFLSVPRFALLSLSFFVFLGEIKKLTVKIFLASLFLVLQTILLVLFIQGYFVA